MIKEAEDQLIRVLEWLCTDAASTAHLNRFKQALGRTDFEGTLGLDGVAAYPGDTPPPATVGPVVEAPAEPVNDPPAEEPAAEEAAPA